MTQPKTIRSATRIRKWIQYQRDQRKKQEKNHEVLQMRSQDFGRQNARLEAQRSYWQEVVEGIADEVWVCDLQGRMSLINLPEVTQMGLKEFRNLSIDEVMEIVEILNADGQPRPLEDAPLLRSLQGEVVRGEEIMRDRRSGLQRYRQFSSAPTRDANGGITGAVAVVRDITEQKLMEEALRVSEERFDKAFQATPNALVVSRLVDGRIDLVNDSFIQLFGYGQAEVLGKTSLELHMFADPDNREELIARLRAQGSLRNAEVDIRTRSGEVRRACLSIERITVFGEDYLLTIIEDITERKRMEQALRDSQQKTREILESISDGFFALDRDWRFTYANRRAARQGGFEPEEMIGRTIWECFPYLEGDPLEPVYRQVMKTRTPANLEWLGPASDSWYAVSVYPSGEGISIYWLDISEKKKAERVLVEVNEQLEQRVRERTAALEQALEKEQVMRQQLIQAEKYEALSRLIASVAHEMNNPLQTVQNSLFLLRNAIPAGKPQDLMEMAIAESQRMGNLVNQLRETYRPSSFQAVDFNLVEVIRQVYGLLAPQLRQENILWQMNCEGESLLVHGVPDQLKQVFLNICLNAVDAMEGQGGKIQVCVAPPNGREEACVSVHDSGPGIPGQHLARVFEPFFTTKEKGTGLGLAISYEIIKDHGGEIAVESKPGEGATFQVCLPLRRD